MPRLDKIAAIEPQPATPERAREIARLWPDETLFRGNRIIQRRFASFADLCAYVSVPGTTYERYYNRRESADFYGILGEMPVVTRLLQEGWPEGVVRMREVLGTIEPPRVVSVRRRGAWADQGDTVDMARMYAGHFERAFRTTRREASDGVRRVRIACNVMASANVKRGNLFYRGAVAAALAEALATAGYAVAVDAVVCFGANGTMTKDGRGIAFRTAIKPFDAPVSVATLTAMLAHESSFRRVHFSAASRASLESGSAHNEGLGATIHLGPAEVREVFGYGADPAERLLVVPSDCFSADAARAAVTMLLDELATGKERAA